MLPINDDSRKWWILIAMGAVGGVILLDETVVGVALPTIRKDLGMSSVASHWVVSAYLLVFTGFAAAGGKIGDVIGLRIVFVVSMLIFGLASLVSGFAPDGAWLIASRAVQGVGAAVIFPASFAMVTIVFPKEQRGMATCSTLFAMAEDFQVCFLATGGVMLAVLLVGWFAIGRQRRAHAP